MASLLKPFKKRRDPSTNPPIQILSDLHLELNQQYTSFTIPETAPLLLLSGDIGRLADYDEYLKFLETQVRQYRKVFLVLGNHEFYSLSHECGLAEAHRLANEPSLHGNLILLHRTRWDDPDSTLTILGCTLWSRVPDEACSIVESRINDFKMIEGWTVQKHNAAHLEDVTWLREQVAKIASQDEKTPRQILVATHHAPCLKGTSRPEHSNNPWSSGFATDLVDRGRWDGVKTWVFGHTHYSTRFVRRGIEIVANQRGYVLPAREGKPEQDLEGGQKNGRKFDPAMIVTI
ncbi:putative calcineurin-like phosphoesterase [Annulohypoxylon maeteangense]|uniref:putative calcineurin-like phosphoesterase n=1 Tax=Annulohypoxylon maeteangense TaxID=1927788 RepID=UPI0020087EBD|nr:putative calcineurin-like phosphoesterase [Annulohypoxylon maeteangense]KAI0880926.1 putative calcineurin-like phosphoesterase [Annulohypoxylon maeteangense]